MIRINFRRPQLLLLRHRRPRARLVPRCEVTSGEILGGGYPFFLFRYASHRRRMACGYTLTAQAQADSGHIDALGESDCTERGH